MATSVELPVTERFTAEPISTGGRRPGRWLAWLLLLMIVPYGAALVKFCIIWVKILPTDESGRLIAVYRFSLPFLEWLFPPLAGLVLMCWRRPAGFYVALFLLCLVPVATLCEHLRFDDFLIDTGRAARQLLFIILQSGIFHTAGYVAFLLGVPAIRHAYGFKGATDGQMVDAASWRARSWIGLLCFFLLLPMVGLVAIPGNPGSAIVMYWEGRGFMGQAVCLIFAVPLGVIAALLMKYRHRSSLRTAIAALWVMGLAWPVSVITTEMTRIDFAMLQLWRYLGDLPHYFGFDFAAALAWTAYLLNAPRIGALYPVSRER